MEIKNLIEKKLEKPNAPFSENVIPYFKKYPMRVLEINCGEYGYRASKWDSQYPSDIQPSLCLPHMHDFRMYWWPVEGLTILLNCDYEDSSWLTQFAHYLTNCCKACSVFTIVDGEETKFMNVEYFTT